MAKCDVCNKRTGFGHNIRHKHSGRWERKAPRTNRTFKANVQNKTLRALAIAGASRWPLLPDVPTVAESGFPGFEAAVWYAFIAPRGTPPEIIAKLNEAANAYLKTKTATDLYLNLGIQAAGGTPDALKNFVDSELEKWAPIIKAANIEF